MKRTVFGLFAGLVVAGTLVAAQDPQPSSPERPAPQAPAPSAPAPAAQPADNPANPDESTLTGCLVQGSGPTVFILDNAKLAADAPNAKGQRYVVEISAPADKIKTVVNNQVRIVGEVEKKDAPASPSAAAGRDAEKDLPKLTAKSITKVGDTCAAGD
jgi:hypothetical protein